MIIHRSFVREVLQTVGAVMVILVSIFLAARVVNILRDAVDGVAPIESVFTLLILKLLSNFNIIIPLVLFVAILLVQNRWSRDNEMIVIKACGVSAGTFIKPASILVAIVGIITATFSLYLGPLADRISRNIEEEFRNRSDISGVVPGTFAETKSGQGVYFVEDFNEEIKQYRDVFVYNGGNKEGVVVANNGFKTVDQQTQDEFLVLKDGTRYEGNPGDPDYAVMDFETYALRLRQNSTTKFHLPLKAIPTNKLFNSSHRSSTGELHWRIAHVLAIPIMTILALSFATSAYRQTKMPAMLVALVTYFCYINFLGFTVAMIRKGELNPHWGLYMVHVIFAAIAIFRFKRRVADRPIFSMLRRG